MLSSKPSHRSPPARTSEAPLEGDLQVEAAHEALKALLRDSYTELPLRNAEKLDTVLAALLQACGITATLFTAGLAPSAIASHHLIYKLIYAGGLLLFMGALLALGLGLRVRAPSGGLRGMDWDALNAFRIELERHIARKKRAQDAGILLFLLAVVAIFAATGYAVFFA
jgi:hypothetical protein